MKSQSAILVVDDEEPVCRGCRRVLTKEGFRVECICDATEGLKMAERREYDAVLLDLRMPRLNGLAFLNRLHAKKPALPVIIITGYPSVESATESARLGAQDFISKPFTPEQIRSSVRRVVAHPFAEGSAPGDAAAPVPAWSPATDDYLFHEEAWLRLGWDDTARVGAFLPGRAEAMMESVVLPRVGDVLHRGLPMAALRLKDGCEWRVPAPLTGRVVEVNESPTATDTGERCPGIWIARIQPGRLAEDLQACTPRELLLVAADDEERRTRRDFLSGLGCRVRTAANAREARSALSDRGPRVLLLDAATFGAIGPGLARRILEAHPDVRIIVLGKYPHRWERAYRSSGVFAYAAAPFADGEILDVLFRAFRTPALHAVRGPDAGPDRKWLHGIRLATTSGSLVRLLVYDASLLAERGVGLLLLGRIFGKAHGIETVQGRDPLAFSVTHVLESLRSNWGWCEHLVILRAEDTGAIPGTLKVDHEREPAESVKTLGTKTTTLIVQPEQIGKPLDFDARTNEALAGHILEWVGGPTGT
jgi:DNA-binding response OmpR family regulator